jgi:galactoside O-acetyltransferase
VAWLTPRPLPDDDARALVRWLGALAERLDDPAEERAVVVRELLAPLVHGRPYDELAEAAPWAAFALDARNVRLEAEHYVATDPDRFAQVKPLLWAWSRVDATPFGASLATGIPFRRMLAERVFARAGRNLKIFPNVEVSVGYNVEAGDDVVLHRHVFLDDIGGIELHDGVSLSDYVHVYSHTHDLEDPAEVTLKRTVLGRGVRVAYHGTVLAGTVLSDDAMLGALGLATRSIDPHVVALGIPARPRARKSRPLDDPVALDLAVDAREGATVQAVRGSRD